MKMFDGHRFKRLMRDLYVLPEILPKREIDKFQLIWKDKYDYSLPTELVLRQDVDAKKFLFSEINIKRRRR